MATHWLILGVGNFGPRYHQTRHNIGFDVVWKFYQKYHANIRENSLAYYSEILIRSNKYICIQPKTFVNLSGQALKYFSDLYNIPIENTLTIVDDVALPLDTIRLKTSGSHGGHNGLHNIIDILGHQKFPRLRLGIGNDYEFGQQVNFVLGPWNSNESPYIAKKIDLSIKIIEEIPYLGWEKIMNTYNSYKIKI